MVRIFLYSSQLASFIGRNEHTNSCRIFNKLFEKYYQDKLSTINLMDKVKKNNVGDSGNIDLISSKLENNKDLREKLDNLCKTSNSSFAMKKTADEMVKKILETEKLSKDDETILKKAADGYTNKKFGTIKEENVVDVYKKRMKIDLVTGIQSRTKKLLDYEGNELWLISKIDAMKYDGTVVEIKNRMYKLFDEVREYEWLQVQTYLEVYNLENAELVEYLKIGDGEMRINEIRRDRKYWEEIVLKELGFYFRVLINLINDTKKIKKYMDVSEKEQNELIKKMVRKEAKS